MSSIVNKIKDAVHSDKHSEPTGSSGPHDSRTANAADPRVDSDRDHRAAPGSTVGGTTGGYSQSDNYTTGGSGMTGSTGTTGTTGTTGFGSAGSTNRGPHDSNVANKMDPRVDSDRDNRAAGTGMGTGMAGTGRTTGTSGMTGSTGTTGYGSTTTGTTGSTNRGPHDSNVANKMDPRFDSDRDNRAAGTGMGTGMTGSTGTTGAGYGSSTTTGAGFGSGSTNRGPHDSNVANKMDPRVDSDRDNRAAGTGMGTGMTGTGRTTGTSGMTGSTGTTGYGSSTTGTSGMTGSTGTTGYGSSTTGAGTGAAFGSSGGPAPNTAGPHKQDILNKADPRIDSDLDGSKTLGQNQTYRSDPNDENTSSSVPMSDRDPTDAAQVPPSVMRKHVGSPNIEHDDDDHDRAGRNRRPSAQEHHLFH